ncbi:hypothetical protein NP493_45g07003 [Ridgeia piscesae]|uniref:Discoidin domain-containing receptor 2 n=1 Tax=Ridgeia piscesae TaxID=27915 RepID=A0AAD9PBN1_RIDPI|nr:hypothetical protein NP493_45g07003 [Ridgeia piscesae]
MQFELIKDEDIRASSSYDEASVGPHNGRIHTEKNGGAWCPKNPIAPGVYEWLEINLRVLKTITLIETQGRFGNGQGQEYAEAYIVDYQREEGGPWFRFRNRKNQEVFTGNSNTYIAEQREVRPPIVARKIRIVPFSTHKRTLCMRVEIYGCVWKADLLSYNMPQGNRRGTDIDLFDFTYDGKVQDNYLSGGLGQLIDGVIGDRNFRTAPSDVGHKGYDWVGWKNDTIDRPPVEIILTFAHMRNFSSVRIHCNNMFNKDVRVFRMAKLFFSIGGQHYPPNPVVFHYMRDTLMEFPRNAIITIPHRVGRYVKLQLFFDARWILISEISFESIVAIGNFSEETGYPSSVTTPLSVGRYGQPKYMEVDVAPRHDLAPGSTQSAETVVNSDSGGKVLDDQLIGIIVGSLAALILLIVTIFIFMFIVRRRKNKYNANGNHVSKMHDAKAQQRVLLNLNDLRTLTSPSKVSNGNYTSVATCEDLTEKMNGSPYREPFDVIQARQLPELPDTPDFSDSTGVSQEYAVPDVTKSSYTGYRGKGTPPGLISPTLPPSLCCVPDVGLQGASGNSVYSTPTGMDMLWTDDFSVMEFPRENLRFVEKLGEGQFGEVHLCEAQRITDLLGDDFLVNRTVSTSMVVAVKTLRRDADDQARADFNKEVKIMSRLNDPNIVRVLGVCTRDEPLSVIVEYMKFGDLHQLLQQCITQEGSTLERNRNFRVISYGCLIYMAGQIASGMKYLESLNIVHRDLASRNCLVGAHYTIKISDFGMSRSLYSRDYYHIEGKAVLPIRWMAWESVVLGKFSPKSDVWSFAVTLWEILTLAREQPFDQLSDEQVIENCSHCYHGDGQEQWLTRPTNCPKEIFDLMRECWNREVTSRPAFCEIHMFLQRKNMGYSPYDERPTPTKFSVPIA